MDPDGQHLPFSTNRTVTGPRLCSCGNYLTVDYDYEHDDGTVEWVRLAFDEVLAYEYREASCCRAEDVVDYSMAEILSESGLLADVLDKWINHVGWQQWHQAQGGSGRFRHFRLYFDDTAAVAVIARSMQVKPV